MSSCVELNPKPKRRKEDKLNVQNTVGDIFAGVRCFAGDDPCSDKDSTKDRCDGCAEGLPKNAHQGYAKVRRTCDILRDDDFDGGFPC